MINIIKQNSTFYRLWLLWFILGGCYLAVNNKGAASLALNSLHTPVLDVFFRYMTWGGDGFVIGIVCLLLFFIKWRFGIIMSLVSFVSAFFVSLLKNFYDEPRPSRFFNGQDLNWVQGIKLYANHSFPSGHSAAAFTMMLILTLFFADKKYAPYFFLFAFLVAVSRVYLFQHFFIDVWIGSLCGVVFGTLLYAGLMATPLFKNKKWHEGSLISLFKKK